MVNRRVSAHSSQHTGPHPYWVQALRQDLAHVHVDLQREHDVVNAETGMMHVMCLVYKHLGISDC